MGLLKQLTLGKLLIKEEECLVSIVVGMVLLNEDIVFVLKFLLPSLSYCHTGDDTLWNCHSR